MTRKKKERSASPKLGASYLAVKTAVHVGAPLAYQALTDPSQAGFRFRLGSRNYQKGAAVGILEGLAAKKIRLANAISRKSVTAMAPEILAGVEGARAANLDPVGSVNETNRNMTGYGFVQDDFDVNRAKGYVVQHAVGWGIRKIGSKTSLLDPVKKFLGMLEGAL